jgi:hypothetical protein
VFTVSPKYCTVVVVEVVVVLSVLDFLFIGCDCLVHEAIVDVSMLVGLSLRLCCDLASKTAIADDGMSMINAFRLVTRSAVD